MDDQDRVEIIDERLPHVRHIVQEWSVAESDALNYAQTKDLIWQLVVPLGLSMIGFKAAERVLDENQADTGARDAYEQFTRIGSDVDDLIEQFLYNADSIRPSCRHTRLPENDEPRYSAIVAGVTCIDIDTPPGTTFPRSVTSGSAAAAPLLMRHPLSRFWPAFAPPGPPLPPSMPPAN
jgi:hypothetical protein